MQIAPVPHQKLPHVCPFAIHALGRDLSPLNFFIQVTDTSAYRFWSDLCPVASANLYHQRARETGSLWASRSVAAVQLCLLRACAVRFGLLFFKGLRRWLCFLLLSSPCWRPQSPCLLSPLFFPLALRAWTYCKTAWITWILQGAYLFCICTKSSNRERGWGRKVSEWLAVISNRKIIKTNPSTVKWSVRGRAPRYQMWVQGQIFFFFFWVPLALGRACILFQKIIESFFCSLTPFYRCLTDRKLYPVLQIGSWEANRETNF